MFFYLTFTANRLQHVVCSNIIATNFLLPFSLYPQKYLLTKQKIHLGLSLYCIILVILIASMMSF